MLVFNMDDILVCYHVSIYFCVLNIRLIAIKTYCSTSFCSIYKKKNE